MYIFARAVTKREVVSAVREASGGIELLQFALIAAVEHKYSGYPRPNATFNSPGCSSVSVPTCGGGRRAGA